MFSLIWFKYLHAFSGRVHVRQVSDGIYTFDTDSNRPTISVMPAQTVSALFRTYYKWGSARTGVALSVSTTIGGVLGEIVSGPVIVRRS